MNNKKLSENSAILAFITAPHLRINKVILKKYGIDVALFIADIFSRWNYFKENNKLDKDDFFYTTKPEITESTGIKKDKQIFITKLLCKEGILEIKRRGLPRRNWYKINVLKLAEKIKEEEQKEEQSETSNNKIASNLAARQHNIYNSNNYNTFSSSKDNKLSLSKEKEPSREGSSEKDLKPPIDRSKQSMFRKINSCSAIGSTKRRKVPSYLETQQEEIKVLFNFWNSLSPPLIKHKENTKRAEKICKILQKKLQKYTVHKIKLAIERYAKLLSSSDNSVSRNSLKLPGYRVGLNEFFGFEKTTRERMKLSKVDLDIKSWFDECLKENLHKKYGLFLEDKFPAITDVLKEEWKKRKGTNHFSIQEENCFRLAAIKIANFIDKNKHNYTFTPTEINLPQHCVTYLFDALKNDNKLHDATVSWLCSDIMFNCQLPRYFKEIGMALC